MRRWPAGSWSRNQASSKPTTLWRLRSELRIRMASAMTSRSTAWPMRSSSESSLFGVPGSGRGSWRMRMLVICLLAMRILSSDRSRHKVVGFEEAWFLLQEPAGQRLIEHLNRWGRSEYATPILVTHLLAEAEQIDNLIGARFIFGQESEAEAIKGLRLLRLDRDDDRLVQRLLSYRKGLTMFRDYEGRVAPIRIDPGPRLLEDLDTTPGGSTGELAA